jgi:Na+-translocating ferredoxin:NAD+ oxidoreductase subunit C
MSTVFDFNPQPARPAWGVRSPRRKGLSTGTPILVAPLPRQVVISLAQGPALPRQPLVRVGDRVLTGQPVGGPREPGEPFVHASISGRVSAIEDRWVAGVPQSVPCVVIDGDGSDEAFKGFRPMADPALLPAEALREGIAEAGILGLGGALFPTARKLSAAHPPVALLLNGAECEPYISCDDMLLRERAARLVAGARLLLAAIGSEHCVIALKTDMPEARLALYDAITVAADPRLALSVVTAKYPAGGERQLIELVLAREVPAGGHPGDVGVVCQNVATAAAVADFFLDGRPLVSRIVTVTGGGIARPGNIEARIGTPVRELVALAGGYQGAPRRLVMGGPMMGIALADDDLPITAATNCLLAITADEFGKGAAEMPCIRCGDCVEACPAGLLPLELLSAERRGSLADLAELGVTECIECGACDFVCPSQIPLTRHFIAGKARVAEEQRSRARAEAARARFEAREERLAREARDRQADLDAGTPRGAGG